ncbi:unnamed protein product [Cylicocyclus nassatus]|uniref:Uncharacterized protein n=1 Tax=Cylicocyclus nassatus TaxID=53992 RepID=A0AA36DKL2_CYLNA|nr:unnamed protein product [Cylicocyclus nassatus]
MLARSVLSLTLGGILLLSIIANRSSAVTTNRPQPSNGNLKSIRYTKTCPKNLYNCGVLNGRNCHRASDAVYYASTSMADAFANCPYTHFAKITFKDGKGDIDIIWHEAYFWCKNNGWEYCKDGWCRPVRHFACYKKA